MSAKRNHYTSTPLMRMDKHPKSVEWEEPPVVLEQDAVGRVRHYRLLQLIMIVLLPIGFIVALMLGNQAVSWGYVGGSLFFVLLMWLLRAFAQSARSKLTLIYVLAASVIVVKLIASSPSRIAENMQRRVNTNIFNSESALDTPTLADFEATDAVTTPEPEATEAPKSAAEMRLDEFMYYWTTGELDSMVSLCLPSWVDNSVQPKSDLWKLTGMWAPSTYYVERVDGSNTDSSRAIMMVANINNQDGTTTAKRYQIMMIRSNDTWYINPNSLNSIGTVTADDPQPFEQISNIIQEATPAPTAAPTVNPQLMLYYNEDGGKYYHVDPYCTSVQKRDQVPLTGQFTYSALDDANYRTLKPCRTCHAPERWIPVN